MRYNGFQIYFRVCINVGFEETDQIVFGFHIIINDYLIIISQPLQDDCRNNTGSVFPGTAEVHYPAFSIHDGFNDPVHLIIYHLKIDSGDCFRGIRRISASGYRQVVIGEAFCTFKPAGVLRILFSSS